MVQKQPLPCKQNFTFLLLQSILVRGSTLGLITLIAGRNPKYSLLCISSRLAEMKKSTVWPIDRQLSG